MAPAAGPLTFSAVVFAALGFGGWQSHKALQQRAKTSEQESGLQLGLPLLGGVNHGETVALEAAPHPRFADTLGVVAPVDESACQTLGDSDVAPTGVLPEGLDEQPPTIWSDPYDTAWQTHLPPFTSDASASDADAEDEVDGDAVRLMSLLTFLLAGDMLLVAAVCSCLRGLQRRAVAPESDVAISEDSTAQDSCPTAAPGISEPPTEEVEEQQFPAAPLEEDSGATSPASASRYAAEVTVVEASSPSVLDTSSSSSPGRSSAEAAPSSAETSPSVAETSASVGDGSLSAPDTYLSDATPSAVAGGLMQGFQGEPATAQEEVGACLAAAAVSTAADAQASDSSAADAHAPVEVAPSTEDAVEQPCPKEATLKASSSSLNGLGQVLTKPSPLRSAVRAADVNSPDQAADLVGSPPKKKMPVPVRRNQDDLKQLMSRMRDRCHIVEGKQEFIATDAKAGSASPAANSSTETPCS
mmetsp:Transcript_21919/g.51234  ORF Transcript_21919/g.51234 Transcript_21919/m.51234 type:complete len:472 (+) Transcript_21919:86-1501(+)